MIWLASFPRSGSTFLRIVLDQVYGIESSTFHQEETYPVDENYAAFPVVKTHLLPNQLAPSDPSIPAVYLVRDGRDCVVSLAHYRRQLIAPESDFELNLLEAIDALEGSHFGGWSEHVRQWSARASLVIRFEDLVVDPIGSAERLRPWLDLPEPRRERLPSFADLRSKGFKYGSGEQHGFDPADRERWRKGKFRRGKPGSWKDELPERFHLRFLCVHGQELARLDYLDSSSGPSADQRRGATDQERRTAPTLLDAGFPTPPASVARSGDRPQRSGDRPQRSGDRPQRSGDRPQRVHGNGRRKRLLIDASKLLDGKMDGIRRYVQELLRAMLPIARRRRHDWKIDVCFGLAETFSLLEIADDIERGQPPLSRISRLFRSGDENPIHSSRERLRALSRPIGVERVRETIRLNYLKTCRSAIKRWQELKRLSASLTPVGRRAGVGEYDLVHLTLPNTWRFYRGLDAPLVTTVHDLSHEVCPEFQAASNNRSLAAGLNYAQSVDSDYMADSRATKDQMVRLLGVDPDRIAVVPLACDCERFRPEVRTERLDRVRAKYGIPEGPYVLSVGTLEPRKNLINTVRAFKLLGQEAPNLGASLVIAGSFGWGNAGALQAAIQACPRIRAIGYVDDEDLPALYSGAAVFSYVSHYEGFGLPLLEAMGCGTATVYGNVASMPEVVGEAGLPAMPNDVQEIKQRLRELLTDAALRRRLSRLAVVRASDFSWEKVAEQTFACYEHLAEGKGEEKGDGSNLCEAPFGPFRQIGPVPFFRPTVGGRNAAA